MSIVLNIKFELRSSKRLPFGGLFTLQVLSDPFYIVNCFLFYAWLLKGMILMVLYFLGRDYVKKYVFCHSFGMYVT